ncbi:hypothetical protein Bhyg_09701, partial [Pseudolycoriella hygida]
MQIVVIYHHIMGPEQSIKLAVLMAAFLISKNQAVWMDYELAGFDNADGSLFASNLRFKRINKTTYGISGTIDIRTDFSNDFEAEMVFFHSANGNNQFVKTPYKVPKDDACKIVDGIYIQSGSAKDVAVASDLPAPTENSSLCDAYKKGHYTMNEYLLSESVIPKYLQIGYYKAQFTATKKNSDDPNDTSTFVLH